MRERARLCVCERDNATQGGGMRECEMDGEKKTSERESMREGERRNLRMCKGERESVCV